MRAFKMTDLSECNSWCRARGIPEIEAASVPLHGYFEPMVGVGFLYLTDSNIAFIDGLLSNPEAESALRGSVLAAIGERLLEDAKELRVKHLILYTQHGNVSKWATSHKFKDCGEHRMYAKELNQ